MTKILHGFADYGVESQALEVYGDVTRATIDPEPNEWSDAVECDLSRPKNLPFSDGEFDLAVLHPPCTAYSDMPGADRDGTAPRLIPAAREVGKRCAEHYVIENKPSAPLEDSVTLDARMFGLPIAYARAFECSFPVEQPPRNARLSDTAETSPFYYSERTAEWWRAAKGGVSGDCPKEHLAKNCLPLPYVHHLMRCWLDATGRSEGTSDYSTYDDDMDERRNREANEQLTAYQRGETDAE